jgi:uncharacterized membrane protein
MALDIVWSVLSLLVALWMRPWRMLQDGALLTPLLGNLVIVGWLWSLPFLHAMPLHVSWSGAPLITLMLGWPLAVPTLVGVSGIVWALTPADFETVAALCVWKGLIPACFTVVLGAALRRWVTHHPFVYVLGRGFFGSVVCIFASSLIAQAIGDPLPNISPGLSAVAYWLMAWGDAFITGMLCAIFVAFKPQWLATWSDRLYLHV